MVGKKEKKSYKYNKVHRTCDDTSLVLGIINNNDILAKIFSITITIVVNLATVIVLL